jgi:hypothetical protein
MVAKEPAIAHLPGDMIEVLGRPTLAARGADLAAAIEAA